MPRSQIERTTTYDAVHHLGGHMRRHRGVEENRQAPREDAYDPFRWPGLGRVAAYVFGGLFIGAMLVGVVSNLPDIVRGHFIADDLAGLTLFALGGAVVSATVIASMLAIIGVQDRREQAKRERMRQGSERHHP